MDSPARKRLSIKFSDLPVGKRFHLVNTIMSGAVPHSLVFKKIETDSVGNNALDIKRNQAIKLRTDDLTEVIE